MGVLYAELLHEPDVSVASVREMKKGIFFTRAAHGALFATIILLFSAQYWLGFVNLILYTWHAVIFLHVIEVEWMIFEGPGALQHHLVPDELPAIHSFDDDRHLVMRASESYWARSGLSMGWTVPSVVKYKIKNFSVSDDLRSIFYFGNYNWVLVGYNTAYYNLTEIGAIRSLKTEGAVNNALIDRVLTKNVNFIKAMQFPDKFVISLILHSDRLLIGLLNKNLVDNSGFVKIFCYISSEWVSSSLLEYNEFYKNNCD